MRADMIAGLRAWRDAEPSRGQVLERVEHAGWSVEQVTAPLGVVGFVFEGRPNVFADATGVLRGGNTVVFRIGSDALGTARAIVGRRRWPRAGRRRPAGGAAVLVDSRPTRPAGRCSPTRGWRWRWRGAPARPWRSSAPIARQAGTPVSLHGTGGAWMVADETADADRFFAAVFHSLDRKVCNTLNVCCIVSARADELVPVFLDALAQAGERRRGWKLHVAAGRPRPHPRADPHASGTVVRAEGPVEEPLVEPIADADLGREWEWEETPEVTLKIVESVDEAVALFNRHSPRFAASLIAEDLAAQDRFYELVDAPFIGDGFTRWVDGQYALAFTESFAGLAMETQGRSLVSRDDFTEAEPGLIQQLLLAHELAHQWFGNAVTPADWSDLWLNESFASYAQWLWLDHVGLGTSRPRRRRTSASARARPSRPASRRGGEPVRLRALRRRRRRRPRPPRAARRRGVLRAAPAVGRRQRRPRGPAPTSSPSPRRSAASSSTSSSPPGCTPTPSRPNSRKPCRSCTTGLPEGPDRCKNEGSLCGLSGRTGRRAAGATVRPARASARAGLDRVRGPW